MSDDKATPKKGVRTVADLKVTGRNKEGEEPLTFGESIHAVFAEHSDAGSTGSLELTDPIVLRALKGWMELDDALAGLPTGTRDELALFGDTGERRWPGAGRRLPEPRLRI